MGHISNLSNNTILKSDLWCHIQKIWPQDHKTYLDETKFQSSVKYLLLMN